MLQLIPFILLDRYLFCFALVSSSESFSFSVSKPEVMLIGLTFWDEIPTVILLEIISSKRNSSYCHSKDSLNLPDQAWQLWNEGKILKFPDPKVFGSLETPTQVVRCILVGLLCVQEHASYRPNTATIVSMLCSDTVLPSPKRPAYSSKDRSSDDPNFSPCSRNSISISNVEGR
ncbi:G-type lectin S-receptor-like serine/threonine-protein kinase SD1-13 [Solanum dulcamara]|uniref:G-type lectin S-receptor-like serine/threonine-protein kinase SD1-13 n=1 Tax=Solanum dulcamara TaxID=45834 RepID=UPI002486B924|nr:G-type lectin S-receptor-like serine/threonine-protein kinase SD1-13 [Solanum dulcamara]